MTDKYEKSQENILRKFTSLNYNLKNEIFKFLEIKEIMDEIRFLTRKIFAFIYNKKLFNHLLINMNKLLKEIDFDEEILSIIKSELYQFEDDEIHLNKICAFLLGKKLKNYFCISIYNKNINFKIFENFLTFKKDLIHIHFNEI